jgi:hypothetical protein
MITPQVPLMHCSGEQQSPSLVQGPQAPLTQA